jgi:hypothetical protein
MPILSIENSPNFESAAPKKGSAKSCPPAPRKPHSGSANPKKPLRPVESKTTQAGAAKTPVKSEEPRGERVTRYNKLPRSLESHDTRVAAAKRPP